MKLNDERFLLNLLFYLSCCLLDFFPRTKECVQKRFIISLQLFSIFTKLAFTSSLTKCLYMQEPMDKTDTTKEGLPASLVRQTPPVSYSNSIVAIHNNF